MGFFDTSPGQSLLHPGIAFAVCLAGLLLMISAKLVIGTSFGLLPATREIVRTGPYRFIRHPIYTGYLMTHVGFILSDFTLRNFAILCSLYVCQVVRLLREEELLLKEEAYRLYCRDVPCRFVYGLI